MKLLEHEAKEFFREEGIRVPKGILVSEHEEILLHMDELGESVVVKAQVDVGGRGKAGGILMADAGNVVEKAQHLFHTQIKGVPVSRVLLEERLPIEHEYYVSIAIDRSKKQPAILFADAGGIDIEETARTNPDAVRKITFSPLLSDIPAFLMRELTGNAPPGVRDAVNRLYHVFRTKDALLAEINPLVITPQGVFAADAKIIVDDNALARQGIAVNRDLSER